MSCENYKTEELGGGIKVCVSSEHSFGADALLLSYFASPKKKDIACDLCSGCGIIPLLWFSGGSAPEKVYAVDIMESAYTLMLESAALSGLTDVFIPVHADLRGEIGLPAGKFDLITCNPPYRTTGSGLISKSEANRAVRHETMCNVNDVCAAAKRLLRFGGKLSICHLPERLPDVFTAMRENRIEPKRLRFVQNDSASAPWLAMIEGKLGAKASLKVEPPLCMTENGGPSAEMRMIYNIHGYAK